MVKLLRKLWLFLFVSRYRYLTDSYRPLPDHEKGWAVDRFERRIDGVLIDEEFDVYPLNDVMVHAVPGKSCNCNPRSEIPGSGAILYIHNALDGREIDETA